MPVTKKPARITRSISFERAAFRHCQRKARVLKRTVNWVVNDLVRSNLDSESAIPAAVGSAVN